MKRILLGTTALAFAGAMGAGQASAADMLSMGVGGYLQQWIGVADRDDMDADGGVAAQSDTEIHFKGSLESDIGLKFSVHVELEGDRAEGTVKDGKTKQNFIDESYARVSGEFGQVEIGARDHAMVRMHQGISDVGIGLNAGDTQKWVPGAYLETSGHAIGNARKLNYISPRMNGVQIGVSYAPDDTTQAAASAPKGNDDAGWGAAINFQQQIADMNVSLSLGHKSKDTAGAKIEYMTGATATQRDGAEPLTVNEYAAAKDAVAAYEAGRDLMTVAKAKNVELTQAIAANGVDGKNAILDATDGSVTRGDAATYTNVGLGVTFGAFGFNVAYAESDGGAYTTTAANVPIKADGSPVIDNTHMYDGDGDGTKTAESRTNNDPGNDSYAAQRVVKDGSKDHSVVGVSVTYTDGPMALSLGHMTHEEDAGGERTATMLSGSYTLAPGAAWKTSLFMVEDTTSHKDVDGGLNEGTGFVTGIAISF